MMFGLHPLPDTLQAQQAKPEVVESSIEAFNERVRQYMKLRQKREQELPKLTDKSMPAEIEANFVALQSSLVAARSGAKPGDLLTSDIAAYIRRLIREELKGGRLRKLLESLREANTKSVQLRVNAPYPETKELVEMPPSLLLKLPTLPKQLHYRFVGRAMVLLDREARLIIDYIPQALP